MPRLVGKQSNTSSYVTLTFLLGLVIGAGVISEYLGVVNLIPGFGHEGRESSNTTGKLIAVQDIEELIGQGGQQNV